jgi:hypothetical protein
LIVISVIITALIHTRSLIVFFIFAISYFIILLQKNFSIQTQHATFFAVFIIFIAELFFIQRNNVLAPLVNGYFMNDVWILLFILLLIPFAIRSHLHLTFLLFIALSIFIAVLFIPSQIPNYGIMTLLDRPYVQMLAYIPLTVLAGLGFSEILQIVQKNSNARTPRPALSQWERGKLSKLKDFLIGVRVYIKSNQQLRLTYITTAIIFGIVIFKANFNYKFYPSECCQLVNRDDLSAIAWIEKNIPTDENILIAVSQLHVTAYEAPSPAAVDAGIWITPLTGRITSVAFIDTNFKKNEIHTFYCMQNVGYIYVGSMPDSFKQTQLNNQPTWYQPVFLLPTTQVYEVIGCK